jgi:hypothetical protein
VTSTSEDLNARAGDRAAAPFHRGGTAPVDLYGLFQIHILASPSPTPASSVPLLPRPLPHQPVSPSDSVELVDWESVKEDDVFVSDSAESSPLVQQVSQGPQLNSSNRVGPYNRARAALRWPSPPAPNLKTPLLQEHPVTR